MTLKEDLFEQCVLYVNTRLQTIEHAIKSHQKALSSEILLESFKLSACLVLSLLLA